MQITASDLRRRRAAAGITGRILCAKAGISRSRLSEIERGYVHPPVDEIDRLNAALHELIEAHQKISEVAARYGWPSAV